MGRGIILKIFFQKIIYWNTLYKNILQLHYYSLK